MDMELKVIHLLMVADPSINGLRFIAGGHLDTWVSTVEQTVVLEYDDDPDSPYQIVKQYGIHHFRNVDENCDDDQLDYLRILLARNAKFMKFLIHKREDYDLLTNQIAMLCEKFSFDPDHIDGKLRVCSIPLSEYEYGWWKSIQNKEKRGELADEDIGIERAHVLSRGIVTVRADIFTVRTDDPDARTMLDYMKGVPDAVALAHSNHMDANMLFERTLSRCGIVDIGTNIYPISSGIIFATDMWDLVSVNSRWLEKMGYTGAVIAESPEDSFDFNPEIAWIAHIPDKPYMWSYWRTCAWCNNFKKKRTYFNFGYRFQMMTEAYLTERDFDLCPRKVEYPQFIQAMNTGNFIPIVDSFFASSGRSLVLLSSDSFNYIYEKHCLDQKIEYQKFWEYNITDEEDEDDET